MITDNNKKQHKNKKPFRPTKSDLHYESLIRRKAKKQKQQYKSKPRTSSNPFGDIHFYDDSEIQSTPHVVRPATRHLKHRRLDTRGEFILNANRQNHASAMRRVHRKKWLVHAMKTGKVKSMIDAASYLGVTTATISKYLREIRKAKAHKKHNGL